uniref:Uncharacterized protein n=1 Tax=Oryza brachyantha TaxID=4533 RepID=J3LRU3_ORYBR
RPDPGGGRPPWLLYRHARRQRALRSRLREVGSPRPRLHARSALGREARWRRPIGLSLPLSPRRLSEREAGQSEAGGLTAPARGSSTRLDPSSPPPCCCCYWLALANERG